MPNLTSEELADCEALLREHWSAFCDADPVPEDFIETMDHAGLVQIRKVRKSDIEADPFAAERGIELGGWLWELSPSGRAALAQPAPPGAAMLDVSAPGDADRRD